jgi:hypothetical protein
MFLICPTPDEIQKNLFMASPHFPRHERLRSTHCCRSGQNLRFSTMKLSFCCQPISRGKRRDDGRANLRDSTTTAMHWHSASCSTTSFAFHKTLRVAPAMAAGVSDRLWSMQRRASRRSAAAKSRVDRRKFQSESLPTAPNARGTAISVHRVPYLSSPSLGPGNRGRLTWPPGDRRGRRIVSRGWLR